MRFNTYVRVCAIGGLIGLGISIFVAHSDQEKAAPFRTPAVQRNRVGGEFNNTALTNRAVREMTRVEAPSLTWEDASDFNLRRKNSVLIYIAMAQYQCLADEDALETIAKIEDSEVRDHARDHLLADSIQEISFPLIAPGTTECSTELQPVSGVPKVKVADSDRPTDVAPSANRSGENPKRIQPDEGRNDLAQQMIVKNLARMSNVAMTIESPGLRAISWCSIAAVYANQLGDQNSARDSFRRAVESAQRVGATGGGLMSKAIDAVSDVHSWMSDHLGVSMGSLAALSLALWIFKQPIEKFRDAQANRLVSGSANSLGRFKARFSKNSAVLDSDAQKTNGASV